MSIYVRDADGNRQKIAGVGLPGPAGKSAYQYAVEGGFSGTEEEFRAVVGVRSNPNLLDNWYFADPINQRGQIKYTDDRNSGVYSIDRWEVGWLGTIEVHDGFIRIVGGPQKGSVFNLQQKLEQTKKLNGRIVTASIMYSHSHENIGFGLWDQFASLPNTNGNIGVFSTTKIYHEGETFAIMATSENATIDIYAVKLELGPVQTLAHRESGTWVLNDPPPNKALELAKCQRYQLPLLDRSGNYGCPIGFGVFQNTLGRIIIPTPTTMRGTPTLTVLNGNISAFEIIDVSGTPHPVATITTQGKFSNGIYLGVTITDTIATSPSICALKYTSTGIPMLDSNL